MSHGNQGNGQYGGGYGAQGGSGGQGSSGGRGGSGGSGGQKNPNGTDINNSGTNALGNEWTNYKDKSYTYENYKNDGNVRGRYFKSGKGDDYYNKQQ